MLSLEDITLLKLLEEEQVLKLSRILKTGLELGLLRDKECTMEQNQCNNQVKIPLILPLLILEALNFQSHPMFLRK